MIDSYFHFYYLSIDLNFDKIQKAFPVYSGKAFCKTSSNAIKRLHHHSSRAWLITTATTTAI